MDSIASNDIGVQRRLVVLERVTTHLGVNGISDTKPEWKSERRQFRTEVMAHAKLGSLLCLIR